MSPLTRRLVKQLPAIFAVGTLGLMMLFGVLGSGYLAAVTMVVGWFILTPLSALGQKIVFGDDESEHTDEKQQRQWQSTSPGGTDTTAETADEADDPVERLRERYARGEIDEVEFERRLETLLATEGTDPETARAELQREQRASVDEELDELLEESNPSAERERE